MATNVNAQICVRRDTAANWTSANPTLLSGEVGYDTTNNKIKIGNGSSTWTALSYLTDATGGGGGSGWPDTSKALWQCEFTGAVPNFTNTPTTAAFAPGPDYYWKTLNSASGLVEQNGYAFTNHFGVVDVTNLEFTGSPNWIIVGNAPPSNWQSSGVGGKPGVRLNEDTHEFVTLWRPFSLFDISGGTWEVFAGCWAFNTGVYPLDPTGGTARVTSFLFVASNANPNWICRARLYGTRPLEAPIDYNYNTGIPHGGGPFNYTWCNMKIVSVPGSGATPLPTIQWHLDGTLIHSYDTNNIGSLGANTGQVIGTDWAVFFTVAGNNVAGVPSGPRMLSCQIDYQHCYSTLVNANRFVPSIPV